jgi:uncharacterized protein RhaS with RHS repeats
MFRYIFLITIFSFFSFANIPITYTYQEGHLAGHLLKEYYDPSGLRLTKNIYDDSGRLTKTIDPDGNIVEFTHDIEGKEEIIKDKLGRV